MVRLITVEREYGSQGAKFAHLLADRLGWRLIDSCLIEEVARKARVTKALAERCDERLDPWYYRFGKAFWHGSIDRLPALPETGVFDSERMVEFVQEYLQELAAVGHCVIVGRGATCALSNYPGAFHIFVYASRKRKIQWFEQTFPDKAQLADQEIQATDRRREAYVQRFYQQQWDDHRLYHLMLNSCMGFDAMIKATLEATGIGQEYTAAATAGVAEG